MSHFAKVQRVGIGTTSLGIVKEVIVAEQDFVDHMIANFPEDNTYWVQTSYNTSRGVHILGGTPFRKNFASPGMLYDPVRDAFYDPKPYPSFVFDESTCSWNPPDPKPSTSIATNQYYFWDEFSKSWVVKTRDRDWFNISSLGIGAT